VLHGPASARDIGRGQLVDVSLHECQLGTLLGGPGLYGNSPTAHRVAAAHSSEAARARSGSRATVNDLVRLREAVRRCMGRTACDGGVDRGEFRRGARVVVATTTGNSSVPGHRWTMWHSPDSKAALGSFFASKTMSRELYGRRPRATHPALAPCATTRARSSRNVRSSAIPRVLHHPLEYPELRRGDRTLPRSSRRRAALSRCIRSARQRACGQRHNDEGLMPRARQDSSVRRSATARRRRRPLIGRVGRLRGLSAFLELAPAPSWRGRDCATSPSRAPR